MKPLSNVYAPRGPVATVGQASAEAGYAAIDALVALSIIASTIIMSFPIAERTRAGALAAFEARQARALLIRLAEATPRDLGRQTGSADGFSWRIDLEPTSAERPIEICRRAVRLVHDASKRAYAVSTRETCPPSEPT